MTRPEHPGGPDRAPGLTRPTRAIARRGRTLRRPTGPPSRHRARPGVDRSTPGSAGSPGTVAAVGRRRARGGGCGGGAVGPGPRAPRPGLARSSWPARPARRLGGHRARRGGRPPGWARPETGLTAYADAVGRTAAAALRPARSSPRSGSSVRGCSRDSPTAGGDVGAGPRRRSRRPAGQPRGPLRDRSGRGRADVVVLAVLDPRERLGARPGVAQLTVALDAGAAAGVARPQRSRGGQGLVVAMRAPPGPHTRLGHSRTVRGLYPRRAYARYELAVRASVPQVNQDETTPARPAGPRSPDRAGRVVDTPSGDAEKGTPSWSRDSRTS